MTNTGLIEHAFHHNNTSFEFIGNSPRTVAKCYLPAACYPQPSYSQCTFAIFSSEDLGHKTDKFTQFLFLLHPLGSIVATDNGERSLRRRGWTTQGHIHT